MPRATDTAVPHDLALWLAMGLGAVGTGPGVCVTLARYGEHDNRVWVALNGYRVVANPVPAGQAAFFLMLAGVDSLGDLWWEPGWDEPTTTNPFPVRPAAAG